MVSVRHTLALASLMLVACNASCSSCNAPGAPASSAALSASAESLAHPPSPLVRHNVRTNSPGIALGNLEGDVTGGRKRTTASPKDLEERGRFIGALVQHAQVVGNWDELIEAVDLGMKAPTDFPGDEGAKMLHIKALSMSHRFREALSELDTFEAAHKELETSKGTRSQRGTLLLGVGRYDDAMPLLTQEAKENPSVFNLDILGTLYAKMGKLDVAEEKFVASEAAFRNVSPFPLCDLYFDRASVFETNGQLDKAEEIFFAAHDKLPEHVHVAVHLAALLPPQKGVAVLEPLIKDTKDPDVMAAYGTEKNLVEKGSGDAEIARARARYDELMQKLPEAFADHAGWFWLGAGDDPKKAFSAAGKNLEQRETAESLELYLAAATRVSDHDAACNGLGRAKAYPYPSKRLIDQMKLVNGCPDVPVAPSASASASASASPSAAASASALPSAAVLPSRDPCAHHPCPTGQHCTAPADAPSCVPDAR